MKRLLAIVAALCLALPCAALCEAGALENRSTRITATVGESYTVLIPPSMEVAFNVTSTRLELPVTALRLAAGHRLAIKPSVYDGALSSGNDVLKYKLMNGLLEFSDANPLYYAAPGIQGLDLVITQADWNAVPAGSYTDTVTFAVAIVDAP